MMIAIGVIIGVFVGFIAATVIIKARSIGSLKINNSDPDDAPYLFLELSEDVNNLFHKSYVVMKVDIRNDIPRK